MNIDKNVCSGQCKNHFIRIQIGYTAYFFGEGWLPAGWSGLQIGLKGPVNNWPRWYQWLNKQMSFRRIFKFGKGWE